MRGLLAMIMMLGSFSATADPKRPTPTKNTVPKAPALDVRTLMDASTMRRVGLSKLTDEEIGALNLWITELALVLVKDKVRSGASTMSGTVVTAANDETFVIETTSGRAVFKARTYCFGINDGDEVVFAKSPGVCTSNTFVTKRGKSCDVWCE
jgi:hypothetical protein